MEDGTYIVKDGTAYKIAPKIKLPYGKRVNVQTGEVYYPTNADRVRAMTDEELARWIADDLIEDGYYEGDTCYELWLDWLRKEVTNG